MSDLLAARSQMGMSLAFHIIFAVVGVALPLMMTIAEFLWHKTGDAAYLVMEPQPSFRCSAATYLREWWQQINRRNLRASKGSSKRRPARRSE